jgi:orotate phosphoribosyltransferase
MDLVKLFKDKGALLEGHFVLSSGLHSDRYLQTALLLQYPDIAEQLGKELATRFSDRVDVVVSPAIGGLIIGQEVARAKKCRAIFSEKDDQGKPALRRGFALTPNENVLVIEDVITTGLSTAEVVKLVQANGGQLVGIGSVVNRSQGKNPHLEQFNKSISSLLTLAVESWQPSECRLCKQGIPAVKPGSRKIHVTSA